VPVNANIRRFAKSQCIGDSSNECGVTQRRYRRSSSPKKSGQKEPLREHGLARKIAKTNWSLTIMTFQGGKLSEETVTIISFCGLTFLWIVNPQSGQWGECYEYYGVYYEVYVYVIPAPLLHYLCRPGALFFSSLLPSSTINTISKGNLYSFICTPKRGTEGFIGQSKRFISFGPTTGDVHCTIPVRKRFQSRISNLFQTS